MKRTIAIFGSARRHGNTGQLLDGVAHKLGIDVIDLSERNISPYTYEHLHRHDDFEPLVNHVLEFESIIFASPVYWYAVSPPMKIFLDRLSDLLEIPELRDKGRALRGKNTYVVCTSIEERASRSFITAFKHTFAYLGMRYGGHIHANCRDGYKPEAHEHRIRKFTTALMAREAGVAKANSEVGTDRV